MAVEFSTDLVTQHEIAARFKIPPYAVRNWVVRGKLPAPAMRIPERIGRPLWVWNDELREIVQQLIDAQRVKH